MIQTAAGLNPKRSAPQTPSTSTQMLEARNKEIPLISTCARHFRRTSRILTSRFLYNSMRIPQSLLFSFCHITKDPEGVRQDSPGRKPWVQGQIAESPERAAQGGSVSTQD